MSQATEPDLQSSSSGAEGPGTKVCARCRSRFSGDARFCPFDGEQLELSPDTVYPDPLLGSVIDDRYEVEEVLGEGGMGMVYRARHRILERRFALKVLRADLARDADLGERFLREAKAAASVSHPNVVEITDFGALPTGQPYFVMELLTGESLSSILRRGGPLPAARAVRLLRDMIGALAAAHAAGVVHRDLKPDNVLVCNTFGGETVKILDFGLAKVAGQSRLTKAGVVFGTPHYMSPEQATGGTVDERTDVYALGVVMYEMFTGRVPFEADTYMGVLTKHLYVAPTPPSVVLGGLSELGALEAVVLRCLEKNPERRYASMQELGDALGRIVKFHDDGGFTVEPAQPGERRPPRLSDELELPTAAELRAMKGSGLPLRSSWTVAGAVVAVVIVAGVGVSWALRAPRRTEPTSAPASVTAAPSVVVAPLPRVVITQAASAAPVTVTPADAPAPSAHARESPAHRVGKRAPRVTPPGQAPPVTPGSNNPIAKDKIQETGIVDPWSH